jgi:hypothetical protein
MVVGNRECIRGESIIDVSNATQLLWYGQFLIRYPDICPFCFSKYPEDNIKKTEHVIRCARMARFIREDVPQSCMYGIGEMPFKPVGSE